MKIFHLFSNYKFTGPADPALLLAKSQQDLGHTVTFFGGNPTENSTHHLQQVAAQRGLDYSSALQLSKHLRPWSLLKDVSRLKRLIETEKPDWIHCHLPGDHLLACLAKGSHSPLIVKSQYDLNPLKTIRGRYCRPNTDLWVTPTASATHRMLEWRVPQNRILERPPVIDLIRFQPDSRKSVPSLEVDPIRVGVVARMQRHRRFPELIRGFSQAARENPCLQLHIFGRGTHQNEVAKIPAKESGFSDRIHFQGYLDSEDYPARLRQLDILIFLVPGSDGTCRAAREAMACGVPVISSNRGLLPELIPAEAGILLESDSPDSISRALLRLARDYELRRTMGSAGRSYSESFCSTKTLAKSLDSVLQGLSTVV